MTEFSLDDITLDPNNRLLLVSQKVHRVTDTELRLLDVFIKNRERNLSRAFLIERVWDTTYAEDTRLLQRPIRGLRGKLDTSKHWYIFTVWGWGYRFCRRTYKD